MTNKEQQWRDAIEGIVSATRLLVLCCGDLPELERAGQRALDIGPIFDPTAWMKKHKALEEDLELMRLALPLYQRGQEMLARTQARVNGAE